MTRIGIVSSHRAERGLLQPLINRLEAHPDFRLHIIELNPHFDIGSNCLEARSYMRAIKHDLMIVPCDRAEALAGALTAFELNIPIIHFHAGDTGTVSKDEVYRHAISLMASVHLCNGPSAKKVVIDLLTATGRSTALVYDVGSTAMDDIEIEEPLMTKKTYDLVLYHPPSDDPELINRELDEIEELLDPGIPVFWCHPNGDPGSETIIKRIRDRFTVSASEDMPRPQFLGHVKNCRYFIGNSSSMVCEAPMWLSPEHIIHIGDRNRNRSFDEFNPGATDRILGILEVIARGPIR